MRVLTVNVGRPRPNLWDTPELTGIDKWPADGPVAVTVPGPLGEAGLAGDRIFDARFHGGYDQAVYAYAREELDDWAAELGVPLRNGVFGENLTTAGIAVSDALIGERWRVGDEVILEASAPRLPCGTFQGWLGRQGWIRRFLEAARPGTYFRVIQPGSIQAGDPVEVLSRPEHGVTSALTLRALTLEKELLPRLLTAPELPADILDIARRRTVMS
jgi:MOSC domain-containing protein YiiM